MHLSWTLMGSIRPNIFLFLWTRPGKIQMRSEEHTSELQSQSNLVRRLLLEKKKPLSVRTIPAVRAVHTAAQRIGAYRTFLPLVVSHRSSERPNYRHSVRISDRHRPGRPLRR